MDIQIKKYMKKKNKKKSITKMINKRQMRAEWNFSVRMLLGFNNKEIHGRVSTTVHNG
jgi:hypothetical protein